MSIIEKKSDEILELIKIKLFAGNPIDHHIGFFIEDIKKVNSNLDEFFGILSHLRDLGFILNIKVTDEDEVYTDKNGQEYDYYNFPELFPGIFIITLTKNFDELLKKRIPYLDGIKTSDAMSRTENAIEKIRISDWGELSIEFINEHDVYLRLRSNNKLRQIMVNYVTMGFVNEKNHEPSALWILLKDIVECRVEKISLERLNTERERNALKNKAYQLNKKLKKLFKLDSNPIKHIGKYVPEFNLAERNWSKEEVRQYMENFSETENEDPLGIEEAYKEATPSIQDYYENRKK